MAGIELIQDLAVVMITAGAVGWLCHRLGLSVIVGYLAAGMVVGPYTPPFAFVSDSDRIQLLAQIGLVFLMFAIGMRLSLRRLRRLGLPLLLATFLAAMLVLNVSRLVGFSLGWTGLESLFLAAMLMVSSSAIIGKVLHESGATHDKTGQLAMGVTVLEDIVAVVMLTLLNSIIQFGGPGAASLGETLGLLGAFVTLAGIVGLLIVPWILRKLSGTSAAELQTIVTAGLLFSLALAASQAGYSLALGAFLLGAIVAETPERTQVDRAFEGLRDLFSAVFFVAIGMMIDVRLLGEVWWLVGLITVVTLVARTIAVAIGLVVVGTPARDAYRVGLALTPIGEFSFIIAQLGVLALAVPATFYPLAVGVSLLTTLLAPMLIRNSAYLSAWMERHQPRLIGVALDNYHRWLKRLHELQKGNLLWQLSRRRLVQIFLEILLVTGLLAFSQPLFDLLERTVGPDLLFEGGLRMVFWVALSLLVLAPLVAIWRNVSALALLCAEVSVSGQANEPVLRPLIETMIKGIAGIALFIWLWGILPLGGAALWVLAPGLLVAAMMLMIMWRKLIFWHSRLEGELHDVLAVGAGATRKVAPWLREHEDWNLNVVECTIPDRADCSGRTISDLRLRSQYGCTVVGIERQGFLIPNPSPFVALYPRDKVLLMGNTQQISEGRRFLQQTRPDRQESGFDEVRLETVHLGGDSDRAGKSLGELDIARTCGVLVAGIKRDGKRVLNPGAAETLRPGDEILVFGSPDEIKSFSRWLRDVPRGEMNGAEGI